MVVGLLRAVGLRPPRVVLRALSFHVPLWMVALVVFGSYFLVVSGVIYDVISESPSMGQEVDPVTGAVRPQAFVPYRLNAQYIIEGFTAGSMFMLGAGAFVLLDAAAAKGRAPNTRYVLLGAGILALVVSYNLCIVFLRKKIPDYLRF